MARDLRDRGLLSGLAVPEVRPHRCRQPPLVLAVDDYATLAVDGETVARDRRDLYNFSIPFHCVAGSVAAILNLSTATSCRASKSLSLSESESTSSSILAISIPMTIPIPMNYPILRIAVSRLRGVAVSSKILKPCRCRRLPCCS